MVIKVVIAVAILLALLFVVIKLSQHPVSPAHPLSDNEANPTSLQVQKVAENTLPNKFPANLPIEKDGKIIQNFNATEVDGRYNATREFESQQTLAQNIATYTKYLTDNGWEIKAKIDQSKLKMVMGKKENQQLQISVAQNPTTKTNLVTITLTEFK